MLKNPNVLNMELRYKKPSIQFRLQLINGKGAYYITYSNISSDFLICI